MFALSLEDLIAAYEAKTESDISIMSALHHLVPNAEYGFPAMSTGEVLNQEDYESLTWLDQRPKPDWSQIQTAIPAVLQLEKYLDLDGIRKQRYSETPLVYQEMRFEVSPSFSSLLSELIAGAEAVSLTTINLLTVEHKPITMSIEDAKVLQSLIRQKLNQWAFNPIAE